MDEDDQHQPKLGTRLDHLFLRDSRTPEERAEAEAKERKPRRGGNRNWMLKKQEKEKAR